MTIRIRPFRPEDSATLVDVYNQARPIEIAQLTEERFWSWYSDPALDAGRDVLVAEDEQGLVGVAFSFPWESHLAEGYVFMVGPSVLPEFQRHGVGKRLLDTLLAELAGRFPGKRLQTRLNHANSQAHDFLLGAGFAIERRFWAMTHHAPGRVPASDPPAGFDFGYLRPDEDPTEAVSVYRAIGGDGLSAAALLDAEDLVGWAKLQDFADNSFLLARQDGKVVGLCFQTFHPGGDAGHIQFLGVLPAVRGLGVASYLLRLALKDAHDSGRDKVRLEVSGDSDLVQALYARLGFQVTGGETFYERPIEAPAERRL